MRTKIIKKLVAPFSTVITIGLEEGYSGKKISKQDIITCIQEYQDKLIDDSAIFLSAKITTIN